jgi:hypothetical protein
LDANSAQLGSLVGQLEDTKTVKEKNPNIIRQ